MKKNKYLVLLFLIILHSCKNTESNESVPTISQSIDFIIHKIDGKDITLSNRTFTNVTLKEENGKFTYSYEYTYPADNTHFYATDIFYIKDISGISNSGPSIKIELDKNTNHAHLKSLNNRSYPNYTEYGTNTEVWMSSAFINVRKQDKKSVLKAFKNIVRLQNSKRATDYFENNN